MSYKSRTGDLTAAISVKALLSERHKDSLPTETSWKRLDKKLATPPE
jgi:hypothetical protein